MISENLIREKFYNYLVNKGFPEDNIIMDYSIKGRSKIDFTITSGYSKTPVMFFEIKVYKSIELLNKRILSQYNILLHDNPEKVQMFIVFYNEKNDSFDVFDVTEALNGKKSIEECLDEKNSVDILNYKIIKNGLKENVKLKMKANRQEKIKGLKIFSWIITPVLFITIILLEIFTSFRVTTNDLFLLGGTIIIVLLPFLKEIKISDVSLKLEEQFDKESKK